MLKELSVDQFVREVASATPAPGGGSVAALAGAQAAGLISMYCRLSLKREKYGDAVTLMEEAGNMAGDLSASLIQAVDEDSAAFNRVMDAYRLSRITEEEKIRRAESIQEATLQAARVPLVTAEYGLRLLKLVEAVAGCGNPSASTDLGVGNLQAFTALIGAGYNVRINLDAIKDAAVKEQISARLSCLLDEGQRLFAQNRALIEQSF